MLFPLPLDSHPCLEDLETHLRSIDVQPVRADPDASGATRHHSPFTSPRDTHRIEDGRDLVTRHKSDSFEKH
jgi:hypothetical protein